MPTPIDFAAYLRYVQGKATPAEGQAMQNWLTQPTNAPLALQWMQAFADTQSEKSATLNDGHDYNQLLARVRATAGIQPASVPFTAQRASPGWYRWAAAAAVAGIVAGAGWLGIHRFPPAPDVQYATGYGETRTVTLPDGSEIVLNAHSTLHYAAEWPTGQSREVWLDGEGYFSVKHQADNQRFVVHTTAELNVEVLGTKFTVYRRHGQARVVLLTGKVLVDFTDPQRPDVTMRPGELVETFDAQPAAVVHQAVEARPYAAWTDHRLVFTDAPLAEVATRVQDVYGVPVDIANAALRKRKFTGTIPMGDLDLLCQTLVETLGVRVAHQPRRIVISTP